MTLGFLVFLEQKVNYIFEVELEINIVEGESGYSGPAGLPGLFGPKGKNRKMMANKSNRALSFDTFSMFFSILRFLEFKNKLYNKQSIYVFYDFLIKARPDFLVSSQLL